MYNNQSSELVERVPTVTLYLKTLAHEGRLSILCHLAEKPRTVSELEQLLDMRQSTVSQMLSRLREEGLVQASREGKSMRYSLARPETKQMIDLLVKLFV